MSISEEFLSLQINTHFANKYKYSFKENKLSSTLGLKPETLKKNRENIS